MTVIDREQEKAGLKVSDVAPPILWVATVIIVCLMIFAGPLGFGMADWFGEWRTGFAIVTSAILMVLLHEVFQQYFKIQERTHRLREQIASERRELDAMTAFLEKRIAKRSGTESEAENPAAG